MFFGWNRVSKKHTSPPMAQPSLVLLLTAYWILVANAWMANPVGMNLIRIRFVTKKIRFFGCGSFFGCSTIFYHAVLKAGDKRSFVVGVESWYLLKNGM
jgi:cytochrome d ubiquinol oxidase subunit I